MAGIDLRDIDNLPQCTCSLKGKQYNSGDVNLFPITAPELCLVVRVHPNQFRIPENELAIRTAHPFPVPIVHDVPGAWRAPAGTQLIEVQPYPCSRTANTLPAL